MQRALPLIALLLFVPSALPLGADGTLDIDGRPVEGWIEQLRTGDRVARQRAFTTLSRLTFKASVAAPALVKALDDRDENVGNLLVSILAKIGRDALPETAAALRSSNPTVRRRASQVMAMSGSEANPYLDDLVRALSDEEPQVRLSVVKVLTVLGPKATAAAPGLAKLVGDPSASAELRSLSATALGSLGASGKEPMDALVKALEDPGARIAAARAIGALGAPAKGAVPALVRTLAGPDRDPRLEALAAIGRIGAPARAAVPAVAALRQDPDVLVREAAALTLTKIDPKKFPPGK